MSLLNPLLAFGAAALLVPLLIHIFNRSRFRTIEWGAMHLLESVISQNRRRFRLDQLILLLIRCLIPAVLAVCLARPVITGSGLLKDAPAGLVLLLDNSYSMEAADSAGTRFAAAVDTACQLVASLPRGSQVTVVTTGGRPALLFDRPLTDLQAVMRRLRQLRPGFGASDMSASLQLGLEQLQSIPAVRRQLVVLSDLQAADWSAISKGPAAALQRQLLSGSVPSELLVFPIGRSAQSRSADNLAVESLELPQQPVGAGQEFFVRARLRSYAAKDFNSTEVSLTLDDQPVSAVQTALKAGGTADVLFRCRSEHAGSHVLTVSLSADDLLVTDNRRSAAIELLESVPVLLIDGDPGTQPLQGETDYLSVALTPWTFGRVPLTDLLQTQVVPPAQFTEPLLKTARVVVLANVSKLSDQQLEWLDSWVRGGGALLVTAGNRLDLEWHRRKLWNEGNGLLPAAWGELLGPGSDAGKAASAQPAAPAVSATLTTRPARIVSRRSDHPALAFFNDPSNGDLSTAEIRRWHMLAVSETPAEVKAEVKAEVTAKAASESAAAAESVAESAASANPVTTAATLDSGDPLLLERRCEDGVVLQLATAVDADWSDLPLRPFYVPLMQQLMTTLAVQIQPPRNLQAGSPAVAMFAAQQASEPGPLPTITLLDPLGGRSGLSARLQGRWLLAESTATQRPGVYTMTLPDGRPRHFAVQTASTESDLTQLAIGQQEAAVKQLGGRLLTSVQEYLEADRRLRHGQEIWPVVLTGLLSLMALEVLLQQRFAGVAR
ncbi:MAG: VWA domain-containing protein [Planctomycetota bacterium]